MILAILAEIFSVGIDYRSGVVIDACDLFFVDRHDNHHAVLFRDLLHQARRFAVGNLFDRFVPTRLLLSAKIGRGENFLHANYLHALLRRLLNKTKMLFNVQPLNVFDWHIGWRGVGALYKSAFNCSWHVKTSLVNLSDKLWFGAAERVKARLPTMLLLPGQRR